MIRFIKYRETLRLKKESKIRARQKIKDEKSQNDGSQFGGVSDSESIVLETPEPMVDASFVSNLVFLGNRGEK